MNTLLLGLSALLLLAWIAVALRMGIGTRTIRDLSGLVPVEAEHAPSVSIVIAARDEARNLEVALRSVLALAYPRLEILVVDDRSSDETPAILRRIAAEHPRLHTIRVDRLPDGWLGKNHALDVGSRRASGEYLLFTDADVVMEPLTIDRAMRYVLERRLDHLTVVPELRMPGLLLSAFAGVFAMLFAIHARPWEARDPNSRRSVGVGAFNLVHREAYLAIGGHHPIALRPDDDIRLAAVLKREGFRQDLLFGREAIHVEWYASLWEAVRGLEKNAFAGLDYSVRKVTGAVLTLLLFNVAPFVALLTTSGAVRWINLLTVLLILSVYVASRRASGAALLTAPLFPIATLVFLFSIIRSTWLALRSGGISWRGTFYPLDRLRRNRV